MTDSTRKIIVSRIEEDIEMLNTYADTTSITSFMSALETLRDNPDQASLEKLAEQFNAMGFEQGTVLSYARYVAILLSDDPSVNKLEFDDSDLDESDLQP
jgi:hypothetical protein